MNRNLSSAELEILQIARDHLGPQNTEQDVFFTDEGEAAIFAKASDGSPCIMLHLTNLADFLRSGSMTRADIIDDIKAGCGGGAA